MQLLFIMEWFTENNNVRNAERQPACKIIERPIGSVWAAKSVTRHLKASDSL